MAMTSWAGTRSQLNASFRWTLAGPGPRWYVSGRAPRHALGRHGPLHGRQDGLRVPVGDGEHRDLHDGRRLFPGHALGVLRGAHARRERIARVLGHVLHGAALHALFHAVGALGVDVALEVAVVARDRSR